MQVCARDGAGNTNCATDTFRVDKKTGYSQGSGEANQGPLYVVGGPDLATWNEPATAFQCPSGNEGLDVGPPTGIKKKTDLAKLADNGIDLI